VTPATRPNIFFIVVDDCGYADLGCTGQTDYATPALDELASEGVRFTQAYANAPLCTNTRVALITGRYQYRLPIGLVEPLRWSDRDAPEMGIPPGHPTLPVLLRGAGYRTTLIGKWHLGYLPRYSPLKSGYDEFFGIMGGYTGYYTHLGDGGEHDLYEGETPVERQGYVTDMLSERAVALARKRPRRRSRISSASIIPRRIGHGRRPQLKRRRGSARSIGPKSSRADRPASMAR
jgi:arylsulfatase A-like enzyme